ncbi:MULTISPECIES: hypothetical protein [unclassified Mesorhizobium]|uniref:hypothetical protein n=1 Tax=unclassified Mesorhizobium TaxID=325217 RepID=UPI0010937727|nr:MULTISPECIES: hypothetical protein [unclassified Mesorhizobium]TGT90898.1 hypothetical protein EN804_06065 [Mesorhizobium sp. M8A.F.Ca.ET.161.01.1.1]TGV43822.1 hypothetical protein EN785_07480 [Mesorhizobium sp. M8A.F.Ca.ET.142.01.1.1]
MSRRPFRAAALHFLVRRFVKSVDGNCTYREIEEGTGINRETARRICHRYGYPIEHDRAALPPPVMAVDRFMATGRTFSRNSY